MVTIFCFYFYAFTTAFTTCPPTCSTHSVLTELRFSRFTFTHGLLMKLRRPRCVCDCVCVYWGVGISMVEAAKTLATPPTLPPPLSARWRRKSGMICRPSQHYASDCVLGKQTSTPAIFRINSKPNICEIIH